MPYVLLAGLAFGIYFAAIEIDFRLCRYLAQRRATRAALAARADSAVLARRSHFDKPSKRCQGSQP